MSKMDYPDTGETQVSNFKPMLSGKAPDDLSKIKYPVLVSPKLDGIRCIIRGGQALSRNLKPIPNAYIQKTLKGLPDGLDGELIVGKPTGNDVWNRSQSGVMRVDGEPDFTFWVFDCLPRFPGTEGFETRLDRLRDDNCGHPWRGYNIKLLQQWPAANAQVLAEMEDHYVREGYEGVMIRDPKGLYKYGRSTAKEGGLLKLKRFDDAEAVVVGMVEKLHNDNVATKDALGRTKRSSAKAGKRPAGTMGALVCTMQRDTGLPIITTFEIGTGFDDLMRSIIWINRKSHIGLVVKFKYQGLTPDGIPRFPVYLGLRDMRDAPDMSEHHVAA